MNDLPRKLLWIDSLGGLAVGVLMFALTGWLTDWYQLPKNFLYLMGAANLAYGSYSFFLARRSTRPLVLIQLLALANLTWMVLCLWWTFHYRDTANVFGLAHLVIEGLYVGGLGCVEWRLRKQLLTA